MSSKIVQQRQRRANAVEAAALANRERLNRALTAKMSRLGVDREEPLPPEVIVDRTPEGEILPALSRLAEPAEERPRVPDFDNLQRFAAWMVGLARDQIRLADRQTLSERHDDLAPRNQRDESSEEAYRTLVDLRRIVQGALGDDGVVQYLAIEGTLPQNRLGLANQLEDTIERLTDPEVDLPEIEREWVVLDWDRLVATLRERLAPLQVALRELDRQQRDAELAVLQKQEALRQFQDDYVGWSNVLRGLYIAASQRELASRLTPTEPTRPGGGDGEPANDDLPEEDVPAVDPDLSDDDGSGAEEPPGSAPAPVVPFVANDPAPTPEPTEEPIAAPSEAPGGDVA